MTPELDGMRDQLAGSLKGLSEDADHIAENAGTIADEGCRTSVLRQYAAACVAPDVQLPRQDAFEKHGRQLSALDYTQMRTLSALGRSAEGLSERLLEHQELMLRLWDAALSAARAQVESVQNELRFLLARQKEHAIGDPRVREVVWAMTDGKCWHCECALRKDSYAPADNGERLFHVDHLVAKANGGPDHLANYVPACEPCNISKGAKSYVEFTLKRQTQLTVIEGGAPAPQAASK